MVQAGAFLEGWMVLYQAEKAVSKQKRLPFVGTASNHLNREIGFSYREPQHNVGQRLFHRLCSI